mmetsp:Transcript_5009/g.12531  ORF Transcript_5009/g.12531 Transcript_5009/m.12531 type:complete len:243 (+) Transcript_5009:321-1049(+)
MVCVPRTGDVVAARCVCVPRSGDPATGVAKDSVDDGVVTDAGECSSSAAAADVGVASNCRAPAGSGVVRGLGCSDVVGAPAGDAAAGAGDATLLDSEGMSSSDEDDDEDELGIAARAARAESGGRGPRPTGPAGTASVRSAHAGENGSSSWYAGGEADVTDGVLLDGADSSSAARSTVTAGCSDRSSRISSKSARSTAAASAGRSDTFKIAPSCDIASFTRGDWSSCNAPATSSIAAFMHSL